MGAGFFTRAPEAALDPSLNGERFSIGRVYRHDIPLILKRNLLSLLSRRLTFRRLVYSLRKQIVFSSPFKDAKYHDWPEEAPPPPQDTSPDVRYNGVSFPTFVHSPDPKTEDWIIKAIETAKDKSSESF